MKKSKASGGLFDLEALEMELADYEQQMLQPDFWNDQQKAQEIVQKNNKAKAKLETYQKLNEERDELEVAIELLEEDNSPEMTQEAEEAATRLEKSLASYERDLLLNGRFDRNDALLEIHPGAGGTEAQDWASMLLRMYQRYGEQQGFNVKLLDQEAGDEAGIKAVNLEISGENAYGLLRSEHGVHRLVRLSPFDANHRRHTSFASVEVMPVIEQETEVEINPDDIKMDVFRSSGAGGQHINKTSSAVRLTHLPTGIVVSSQDQRSQFQNRETAMMMLRAKLARLLEEKNAQELDEIRGEKDDIAWGSQIRSYVFHPYQMVKDHRSNYEESDIQAVMDGKIENFIDAYLQYQLHEREKEE